MSTPLANYVTPIGDAIASVMEAHASVTASVKAVDPPRQSATFPVDTDIMAGFAPRQASRI
jgi:hypothetical protein